MREELERIKKEMLTELFEINNTLDLKVNSGIVFSNSTVDRRTNQLVAVINDCIKLDGFRLDVSMFSFRVVFTKPEKAFALAKEYDLDIVDRRVMREL